MKRLKIWNKWIKLEKRVLKTGKPKKKKTITENWKLINKIKNKTFF